MKRTSIVLLVGVALFAFVFAGCGGKEAAQGESAAAESTESQAADAVTGPTQMEATDAASLQEAVGPQGSWIIIFNGDLTVSQEITISGQVYEEAGAEAPRRKLALYAQDENRKVTARYTLTLPRLIVKHVNTRIQAGQVSGNVYVDADGFELTSGATINGNLYFATQAQRDSANISDDSTVMGKIGIGTVADAVSGPTQMTVTNASTLQNAAGPDGSWIIIFEDDVTVDQPVTVFGAVYEEPGAEAPRRKFALYAQDENRKVTARYTLTVPELIVHHLNTRIQAGTVAGDVYVEERGFELTSGATIKGNLYFASQELQDSANISDDSTVTGKIAIGTK